MLRKITRCLFALLGVIGLALWAPGSSAFPTYSRVNPDDPDGPGIGNCKACHGDFRSDNYISRTDGTNWGNLHDLHRIVMLAVNGVPGVQRCWTCHEVVGQRPVYTYKSYTLGSNGLDPISCVGCHGRYEDSRDNTTHGMGAGLRQHHWKSGITRCGDCHADANPAKFKPVGEHVLPPHYLAQAPWFPNKPTDSCNYGGAEDYAGWLFGLDNDGDAKYDMTDRDCMPPPPQAIAVCHGPQSGDGKRRTLWINVNALDAHAEHGDLLGECLP